MEIFRLLAVLFCLGAVADAEFRRYNGYQVLRIHAQNEEQQTALKNLYNEGTLDFWAGPSDKGLADILVEPSRLSSITEYLNENCIPFNVHISDVEKIISAQRTARGTRAQDGMNWDDYQTIETIYGWLDSLVAEYPNLISIQTIGRSHEGREIKGLKISTGDDANKSVFWIDATIHAREWISTATVTYIINQLVTNSTAYSDIFAVHDFYIIPIINPDGYVYTHTTDRMWRKSRQDHNSTLKCIGTDINRNFGFHFGGPGSSSDKCSETYRGPEAYSEPEAAAVRDYALSLTGLDLEVFITLHSYSQLWMTPWGYTYDLPNDFEEMNRLGKLAASELESVFGTDYTVGSASNVLYTSSGSSRDWAKGEGGFNYVYTIELRDKGNYGFLLPKEQIIPTAVETWAGIQVVARNSVSMK